MKTEPRTRFSYMLFLAVLLFSPLAFGAVEQWSLTVMEGLSVGALLLLLFERRTDGQVALRETPGIVPLLCLLLYFVFQLVPLPAGLVRVVSRGTYRACAEGVGLVEPVGWISLSLQKKAALRELFRFAGYFAFYLTTVQLLTRKELLRKTVNILIVFSFLLSFQAILQKLLNNGRIFWVRELTAGGTPFGPFVNRNHYAGFMEMVFPVVLGVFLFLKPKVSYGTFRERLSDLLDRKETNAYILAGLAALMISTSVFLTLSRSGIVSLCLSMVFFGAMLAVMRRSRQRGMVIVFLFSLIVVSVGWFGWGPVFERFSRVMDAGGDLNDLRPLIWKDSLRMLKDFSLTGTGLGSFFSVYPKYRTWQGEGLVDHAHNDYIELLTDGGAIAFFLFFWFLAVLLIKAYGKFRLRKDPYSVYLFLGSLSGMAALLIHSFTDFNMHIGSNGLYFFFLAGLLVSAANTRFREGVRSQTYLERMPGPWLPALRALFLAVFVTGLLFNGGVLLGSFFYSRVRDVRLDQSTHQQSLPAVEQFTRRASLFDPLEPSYYYAAGNAEMLLRNPTAAAANYGRALRLEPVNGEYMQRLGLACSALKDYDRSEKLIKAGVTAGGRNPHFYRTYGSWLFSHGKKEAAMESMRQAITLEPEKTRDYLAVMIVYGLKDEEMAGLLPEKAGPHMAFADYLKETGKEELAGEEYMKALGFGTKNPSHFLQAYRFYANRGDYDRGIAVMRKALEILPENVSLRLAAADAYEKSGIKYRAVEEYRRALVLDPRNTQARRKLQELDTGG